MPGLPVRCEGEAVKSALTTAEAEDARTELLNLLQSKDVPPWDAMCLLLVAAMEIAQGAPENRRPRAVAYLRTRLAETDAVLRDLAS